MKKRWKDSNPEMGMLNLDFNWEEYGLPKAKENRDYSLPRYIKGSGRKPSSRARRIKQTENRKKRNIRIAKAKGYDLDKCSRPEKAGTKNVLSNIYTKHWKDWYPDSFKTEEQKKFAKKEIKNYPNDIIDWDEFWFNEYFEADWNTSKRDYICTPDKGSGYIGERITIKGCIGKRRTIHASTSVKEVLFDCLLNS